MLDDSYMQLSLHRPPGLLRPFSTALCPAELEFFAHRGPRSTERRTLDRRKPNASAAGYHQLTAYPVQSWPTECDFLSVSVWTQFHFFFALNDSFVGAMATRTEGEGERRVGVAARGGKNAW
jgi:hypothetical protein